MTAPVSSAPAPPDGRAGPPRRRVGAARLLIVAVVSALVALWVYALSGAARRDPPDRLEDRAFAARLESVCQAGQERFAGIRQPRRTEPADARADALEQGSGALAEQRRELAAVEPSVVARDQEMVALWLADWDRYLADRRAYTERLRVDPRAQPEMTARGGRQISQVMNEFVKANGIEACLTPPDF
ncbi:MAG: hypothetical protein ACKVWR_16305 [Acidimicrobiales bacterium]